MARFVRVISCRTEEYDAHFAPPKIDSLVFAKELAWQSLCHALGNLAR
ncbi:MAG: hypothetical protein HY475_01460, partial [Candidatus Terrybacteria bacterium]|nr:hypothetical protein [Candidatus Terrybacteria bacterium]